MFDRKKIKDLILTSLVADSYSLGSHWVYDEKQLKKSTINWEVLNNPLAIWHKGKVAGEFTHYGDQLIFLYEYLKDKEEFKAQEYLEFWLKQMETYDGYIDGATRETLENIKNKIIPSGSNSSDLSIVGRIAPLLLVSNDKIQFIKNVEDFVKLTHNSQKAINTSKFFAKLLYRILDGSNIVESLDFLKDEVDNDIKDMIQRGLDSKNEDTFKVIREFGPACDIDEGFSGVIHLLCKYENLKELLVQNAKAGGDTSARAMIASVIFMANKNLTQLPSSWLKIKVTI